MGDEFIGENRVVDFDFDEVNGDGRYFGLNYVVEGVCEGEVCF